MINEGKKAILDKTKENMSLHFLLKKEFGDVEVRKNGPRGEEYGIRLISPNTVFISWLAMHDRQMTRKRLVKMHIIQEVSCLFCGDSVENLEHLLFECIYSQRCIQGILRMTSTSPIYIE